MLSHKLDGKTVREGTDWYLCRLDWRLIRTHSGKSAFRNATYEIDFCCVFQLFQRSSRSASPWRSQLLPLCIHTLSDKPDPTCGGASSRANQTERRRAACLYMFKVAFSHRALCSFRLPCSWCTRVSSCTEAATTNGVEKRQCCCECSLLYIRCLSALLTGCVSFLSSSESSRA